VVVLDCVITHTSVWFLDREIHQLVTEVIPKAQVNPIPVTLVSLPGFTSCTNFDYDAPHFGQSGFRGISIFISDSLQVIKFSIPECGFHEHLWLLLSLNTNDYLLMVCIYCKLSLDKTSLTTHLFSQFHS